MLVKLSTEKTMSDAAAALHAAVQANHFGVMQVHNLKETMAKKGVEFARECLIVEQTLSVVTTSTSKSNPITKQN